MENLLSGIFDFLLPAIANFVEQNPTLSLIVTILLATLSGVGWIIAQRRTEAKQHAQDRHDDQIMAMQRIRLTETNPTTRHRLKILNATSKTPVASLELELANRGDGPIDILCALVAGRVLDTDDSRELGTRGRNVEWDDHTRFYWNDEDASGLFSGISTVKSMMSSADQYLRLAPKATGILRRKDAIRKARIPAMEEISLKYQGFVVARGYPLGEIWSQLGGRPPDLRKTVDLARLQFRAIARPNLYRWRCVQEALLNLNRLVFRLAVEETVYQQRLKAGNSREDANRTAHAMATDPLGLLMTPDAWRLFLLHHMEFVNTNAYPYKDKGKVRCKPYVPHLDVTAMMDTATNEVKTRYLSNLVIHDTFATSDEEQARYRQAREYCAKQLSDVVSAWQQLVALIEACQQYRTHGYSNLKVPVASALTPADDDDRDPARWPQGRWPQDGYPVRIHADAEHRNLWLAYLEEGYIVSKPFPRKGKKEGEYDAEDIPDDPRDLEPYTILSLSLDTTLDVSKLR